MSEFDPNDRYPPLFLPPPLVEKLRSAGMIGADGILRLADGREARVVVRGLLPAMEDEASKNTPRDTQFAGFAELEASELRSHDLLDIGNMIQLTDPPTDLEYERVKQILARCAYDFARFIAAQAQRENRQAHLTLDQLMNYLIDDMTRWPEESSE